MKQLIMGVGFLLALTGGAYAQSTGENLQKYWKLRNDLRDYFVKIDSEAGASIPANALIPGSCVDNVNYYNT